MPITAALDLALGKKAGTVEDRRTIRAASLMAPDAPAPQTWRIAENTHDWPMYGNDRIGDCGIASLGGHRTIAQEASSKQREPTGRPTEEQVLAAYYAITGGADTGIYLIDGLRYGRNTGFGREADGTPHMLGAYARVQVPQSRGTSDQFRRAARMFGGLYLGLALPVSAAREIDARKPWAATTGPDTEPYSWGGHAVWMIELSARGVKVVTWAREQWMTWEWLAAFADEAWCTISEDLLNQRGRTPQGFNVQELQDRLARL